MSDTDNAVPDINEMFIEQASSLIPAFSSPIKLWSIRIRQSLVSRGLDIKSPRISNIFTPLVIIKLPTYLLKIVKEKKLDDLLSFLDDFERVPIDPMTILKSFKEFQYSPSLEFSLIVEKIREVIGPGINKKAAQIFAYSIFLNMFPASLQVPLALLEIKDFPNADQLTCIVRMFDKHMSLQTSAKSTIVTPAIDHQDSNILVLAKLDNILSRLNILENRDQNIPTTSTRQQWTPPIQSYTAPNRNNYRPYQAKPYTPQRWQQASNPAHCFFHNKFGSDAFKCTPPCSFPKTSKNLSGAPATP